MSVKFLAECKKFKKNTKNYCFWQICPKFTHFPSVKFPGLKMCECKKMTNIRYDPVILSKVKCHPDIHQMSKLSDWFSEKRR